MSKGLFKTRSLKLLCVALIFALNSCNPEKQWQELEVKMPPAKPEAF